LRRHGARLCSQARKRAAPNNAAEDPGQQLKIVDGKPVYADNYDD
jgi:hypothetical protein